MTMSALEVVAIGGLIAEGGAWWAIRSRGLSVWRTLPPVLAIAGVAAILVAPHWRTHRGDVSAGIGLAAGAASGIALYLATRAFVFVVSGWERFRRETAELYGFADDTSARRGLALASLVAAPAEELLWRGVWQGGLERSGWSAAGAAGLALAGFFVANLPSRSIPVVTGALVGGAAWGALAWWSGGVLAPIGSHILWTGLMLAFPPAAGRGAPSEVTG